MSDEKKAPFRKDRRRAKKKTHKLTENKSFDREEFLEEIVDAFNYFFSCYFHQVNVEC